MRAGKVTVAAVCLTVAGLVVVDFVRVVDLARVAFCFTAASLEVASLLAGFLAADLLTDGVFVLVTLFLATVRLAAGLAAVARVECLV